MNNLRQETTAFVQVPHRLQEIGLQPKNILVYAAIRSHMNRNTRKAFPANQRIAKMLGMDRATVGASVKTLLEKGAMTAIADSSRRTRMGQPLTVYHFPPEHQGDHFEPIALPLLMNPQLDWAIKAYIVALMPHLFKQPGQDFALTTYTVRQIAALLNISESAVNSYNERLHQLGLYLHSDTAGQEGRLYYIKQMGQDLQLEALKQPTEHERQMQAQINELQQAIAVLRRQNADQQAALEHTLNRMSGVKYIPQKRLAEHILKKELDRQMRRADADPFIMIT